MENPLDVEAASKMLKDLVGKYGGRSRLFSQSKTFSCPNCNRAEEYSLREKIFAGECNVRVLLNTEVMPLALYSGASDFMRIVQLVPMLTVTCKCGREENSNISLAHAWRELKECEYVAEKGRTPSHLAYFQ